MNSASTEKPRLVAFVPARSGSKRVRHKNIALLNGHPLMAYSIAAARSSGVCDAVVVSTDSELYAEVARHYGAETPFLRPAQLAGEKSPDVDWVKHALHELENRGRIFDCFSILRPTSPCRTAETIRRAWSQFLAQEGVDSLRAVELCAQHPGKMWVVRGARMHPLMPMQAPDMTPYHSTQYAALPPVYVQNASLEIAWSRVALKGDSIAGEVLTPFLTRDVEGLDVNSPYDWKLVGAMVEDGTATLPKIDTPPFDAEKLSALASE